MEMNVKGSRMIWLVKVSSKRRRLSLLLIAYKLFIIICFLASLFELTILHEHGSHRLKSLMQSRNIDRLYAYEYEVLIIG